MTKKTINALLIAALLASTPVLADAGHDHETPAAVPAKGHGSVGDDHSKIVALDVTPEEAVATLDSGIADLTAKVAANQMAEVATGAFALMSAVKTLSEATPNERQAAALKQLDAQLDAAKHAAEDSNAEKATSSLTKAASALKLYKALR